MGYFTGNFTGNFTDSYQKRDIDSIQRDKIEHWKRLDSIKGRLHNTGRIEIQEHAEIIEEGELVLPNLEISVQYKIYKDYGFNQEQICEIMAYINGMRVNYRVLIDYFRFRNIDEFLDTMVKNVSDLIAKEIVYNLFKQNPEFPARLEDAVNRRSDQVYFRKGIM